MKTVLTLLILIFLTGCGEDNSDEQENFSNPCSKHISDYVVLNPNDYTQTLTKTDGEIVMFIHDNLDGTTTETYFESTDGSEYCIVSTIE